MPEPLPMRLITIPILFALLAGSAFAQPEAKPAEAPPACAAIDAELPAHLAGWRERTPIETALNARQPLQPLLALGKGYEVALLNTPRLDFPHQSEKPGGSVAFAGLFSFTVETEGAYTVALGAPAWIDVLEDGKAVTPTSFGHGPICTSVRKMVVFRLKPGTHLLQLSASATSMLPMMIVASP
jgi:hypothetical protein